MRILGIGDWNDLGDLYLQLQREGHEVRVHIADPAAHDILEGLIRRVPDWHDELPWIREAGADGIIVFETAHHGRLQDELRAQGYQVIGGSGFGDRLESDRRFGQQVMGAVGLQTLPAWHFPAPGPAMAFVEAHPGRYVLKSDAAHELTCSTFVGSSPQGLDVLAVLRRRALSGLRGGIMVTRHAAGVEVGIGGYFNGRRFLAPVCLDWEHKRFFPGDIGELTGEMGTLVTYRGAERLFSRTLARFAPLLAQSGYVGYINLHTLVDGPDIWPLEFTARFGYPGFAILDALQPGGWAEVFRRLLDPGAGDFQVADGYALGVVITVPPFPYPDGYERLGKGSPLIFAAAQADDHRHFHLAEVARRDGQLVCAGQIGYPLVVTGSGADAAAARRAAYERVGRVVIPNMRYRQDIGEHFIARDRQALIDWGHLPASC